MRKVTEDLVRECAKELMLEVSEEEVQEAITIFNSLEEEMNVIGELDGINNVQPMTFPFECDCSYLRDDVEEAPLNKEDVLKNAKEVYDGQIKLPKVVG